MFPRLSLLLILVLLLSACQPIQPVTGGTVPAAPETALSVPEGSTLSVDPDVRIGTLDNGLTYYIRANDEPMNRAELWLAINAGSLMEDEDQLGLAHFLEHMLFNGTENFPGMGVVDFLESVGMAFGPDVNAYTSFDETVYTIQVPTDDPETMEKAFQVLSDWAARATLDPAEIEAERGVVVEEWRLRDQTAAGRIQQQTLPFLLGESRYAERLPIGEMDVIRSAPPETVRRFYEQWYRPDLMAVIAVGDFDVDSVEGLIQEHFAPLENPVEPTPRPSFDLPATDNTQFLTVSDPEQPSTTLYFLRRRPDTPVQTVEDLHADLVADLFYIMFNERLADITRLPASGGWCARCRWTLCWRRRPMAVCWMRWRRSRPRSSAPGCTASARRSWAAPKRSCSPSMSRPIMSAPTPPAATMPTNTWAISWKVRPFPASAIYTPMCRNCCRA